MWPQCRPMSCEPNGEGRRHLVASGGRPGLFALRTGRTVGWCAVAPQAVLPQYADPRLGCLAGHDGRQTMPLAFTVVTEIHGHATLSSARSMRHRRPSGLDFSGNGRRT